MRDRMSAGSSIDYDALTQDALRGVVRAVLTQIATAKSGLPGEHHFYIAFNTQAPGVSMSRRLKEKYPDEMMIVLQHRFWDLGVTDEAFEVKLTFDGIPERLYIPFQAMKVFFDPSVRFSLQFGENAGTDEAQDGAARRREVQRRQRPRARPRADGGEGAPEEVVAPAGAQPAAKVTPAAPTVFAPRAVEPVRAPAATPGATDPADARPVPEAKPDAGAKVFSLDNFRKKK